MNKDYNLQLLSYIQNQNIFAKPNAEGKIKINSRKNRLTRLTMINMFRRTLKMFKWEGLPDEIPQLNLELNIQTRGYVCVFPYKDKHYQDFGGLGNVPNYNYMPSRCIVSNPFLGLQSQSFRLYDEKDGKAEAVIIPNDSLYQGLTDTLSFHAELLTEVQLTKRLIMIISRSPAILTAPTNNTFKDLKEWLDNLSDGELGAIFDKNILQNIGSIALGKEGANNIITQVLEMEQYQKASMFNDIGLQMNYNMKRETITSSEAQLGESALLPLCDDMLEQRQLACERINKVLGLNWSVDFSSAWKDLRRSIELENKKLEMEANPSVQKTEQPNGGEDNGETNKETVRPVQDPEE